MSDIESKEKHSKRLQKKECAVAKQVKIAKANGLDVKEAHKFAKHHAMDCGNPGCVFCASPRKTFGETTKQEKSFVQTETWDD